ncbi:large conductance mechanosensitive channel protein MscL [Candidatus Woesebacteria bacterium]|nr:large conductance mechanosensitive channel protein MscL [Candidatus Woesebacteria bacterium]
MFKEFKKFILRGNLIDLTIGFTVGAAFSTFAKSLVTDIIMPPINLILGPSNFARLFIVLREGKTPGPYISSSEAANAGAIIINLGEFLNNLLTLIVVGFAMFLIIKFINKLNEQLEVKAGKKKDTKKTPSDKKCPYCWTTIPFRATRCPACTSELKVKKFEG